MGIERLQRIIAIGGDEDEQRRFYFHQALDNGKSVETRHLYVEEHEIGLMRLDPPDRFPAVDAGRDDFDVRMRIKPQGKALDGRSEEHTSELQSLMRTSYAVFCLKKKKT